MHRDRARARHPHQLHDALRPRRDGGGPDRAPAMLRELQDETGGFLAYIPLAYHPDNNELGEELDGSGTATTGYEDLKNIAVGRLFLDNFAHIKTHWTMVTPFLSQIALHFGVQRRGRHGGAREDLSRGRRAHRRCTCRIASSCGSFAAPGSARWSATASTSRCARSSTICRRADAPARGRAAGGARRMRARAGFRGSTAIRSTARSIGAWCRCRRSWSTAPPSELNDLLAAGELRRERRLRGRVRAQRGGVSSAARSRDHLRRAGAQRGAVLPRARSASSTARRVLRQPQLDDARRCCSSCSSTRWGVRPDVRARRAPRSADLDALRGAAARGACSSSATRRCMLAPRERRAIPYAYDLGAEWKGGPGCRSSSPSGWRGGGRPSARSQAVHRAADRSRATGGCSTGRAGRRRGRDDRRRASGLPRVSRDWITRCRYRHLAGLTDFFRRLAQDGLVPDGSLSFICGSVTLSRSGIGP